MNRRFVAVITVACLVWVTGHTDPSAQTRIAPLQARPIFRAGVESAYVTTAVLVTDKNNKPVTDLKVTDFEISEGGVPQTILDFEYISIPAADRPIDLKAAPVPEPDVATNRPAARTSRAFVFVIDAGTLSPADIVPIKRVMSDFLKKLTPDDEAAMVFVGRSDLGVDFTREAGPLIRGVNNVNEALGWSPDAWASREVMANVIDSLARSPQTRRTVIYVSGGFGVCPPPTADELRPCVTRQGRFAYGDLFGLLRRAQYADVPIYTIDPKGTASPMDDLGLSGRLEDQTPERARARRMRDINGLHQFLRTVADTTGGRGFVRQSDVGWAVNQIMADNSNYYVLGYSPTPFVVDGKFHPIDVKVTSRPDLQVRARQGYVAQKAAAIANPSDAVMHTLEDGQPKSDLSLRAFVAPVAVAPDGIRTVVTVDVEYPALPSGETRSDDELQIAVLAIDSEANVKFSTARTRNVTFSQAGTGTITVPVDETLDLPKGQMTLRIGVTSRVLGKTGTVHLPVTVRSLSGDGPSVTPLVLGLGDPAGGLVTADLHDALIGLLPFRPTTHRTFSRDQVLQVFTRVFSTDMEGVSTRLLLKEGKDVVRVVPLQQKPMIGVPNSMDFRGRMTLSTLPAGTYVLELSARRGRDEPVTRATSFRVQ